MEVGYHSADHPIAVAGSYDDAGGGHEAVKTVFAEISGKGAESVGRRDILPVVGVGIPLRYFTFGL